MAIRSFSDLLDEARNQSDPQRLLFVFAKAELPDDPSPEQRQRFEEGEGGALAPVLCVDKRPDELTDMAGLVEEGRHTDVEWDVAFVAALSDPDGDADVDPHLERMVELLKTGSVERFLAFDTQGDVLSLG